MKLIYFLKKLTQKPNSLLGLDIDQKTLRCVQLNRVKGTYALHSFTQTQLPLQNPDQNFYWDQPQFVDFLKDLIQKSNLSSQHVALALPYSTVLFKTIELDKTLHASEIAIQIQAHAEQYFHYPLSELMVDFELLGHSKHHPDLREVRWVAAKRTEVEMRTQALIAAGLTPVVVEVDSFSLQRAAVFFLKNRKIDGYIAMVHLYFSYLLFMVLHQDKIMYTRVENYLTPLSAGKTAMVSATILRTLQLFSTSEPEINLSLILLSGSDIPHDLLDNVQNQTGVTTEYLNIFSELDGAIEINNPSAMNISAGLAMRALS